MMDDNRTSIVLTVSCDIPTCVEHRVDGHWIADRPLDRDYHLSEILAGPRSK